MKKRRSLIAMATAVLTVSLLTACSGAVQQQQNPGVEDVADIGMDQVMAIVLERVPGATEADVYELECEYDNGHLEYEGSIYYGGYEYEFQIDGASGNILQWEIDD